MAQTKLGDQTVNTLGDLPSVGSKAPDFVLIGNDLKEVGMSSLPGRIL